MGIFGETITGAFDCPIKNKRDFLMEVGDFSFLLREIVLFRAWGSQGRRRSWVRGPFLEVIKAGVLRESALDTVDYGASSIIY
ncbi:uncharacterized protein LOC135170491 isoform X4 [Diachasmimorpha longicaudata]|uniref:uncharacterized protein LOC135170491 isoform X4 n=1 Tax=Diachasmimorpha longicaudata TaxID=58733 RepID=UPI0030B86A4A